LGSIATDFGHPQPDPTDEGGVGDIGDSPNEEDKRYTVQAQQHFAAARKRVGICLGKFGILEAQCFFYCGVFYVTMMQPEAAWTMFLQALASCQGFKCLTRIKAEGDQPSEVEFEPDKIAIAEECTYWTCLKSEL
jgi:hypothetical protein